MLAPDRRSLIADEWKRSWRLPLVTAVAMAVSVTHLYSFGVLLPAIEHEFAWSRSRITFGLTIMSVVVMIAAPFVGFLVDRVGSKIIGLAGLGIYFAALAGLSVSHAKVWMWWAGWLFLASGAALIKPTVWTAVIAARYKASLGVAMAITLAGVSLGAALIPLGAATALNAFGWRGAYVAMAAVGAALTLPLLLLTLPWGRNTRLGGDAADVQQAVDGVSLREGFRSPIFLKLAVAAFAMTFAVTALLINLVPILREKGMEPATAASLAGAAGVSSIVGRLGAGVLLDMLRASVVGAVVFSLPILVCLIFLYAPPAWPTYFLAAVLLGLATGAELDNLSYLAARRFGLRNFGMLFGTLIGLMTFGTGVGPLFSSLIYDRFGSYQAAFMILIPLFAVSALMVATAGVPPERVGKRGGG